MPYTASPGGVLGSVIVPASLKELSKMSITLCAASAAYKNVCEPLEVLTVAMAKPVKTSPLALSLTAMIALFMSRLGFQPLIVPSNVAKMNAAAPLAVPLWIMKILLLGFATWPVGVPAPVPAAGTLTVRRRLPEGS